MTPAIWFWIIYVVALLFYGFMGYRSANREFYINNLVLWVLLFLLGLGTFGSPLKGG